MMDNSTDTQEYAVSSIDESHRVKFLCSFGGSILPRPQDGKLRYVGGETRIVSVPRDIAYEELMGKMRELFEGATVLKYQQPDEDLDALVSVVNDDDVVNMMEEYDKLGTTDGFTRLRLFLFAHPDQDVSLHFGDGDDERRYVDALNSLNESMDFRKQPGDSPIMGSFDDLHAEEQYFNQMNLEGSQHGQRNMELPIAQMNLRRLTIPHLGSGQLQQAVAQRYNEMEAPWSPAYYSPRQPGSVVDQRPIAEFPSSPTSSRFRAPYGELPDRVLDRMPEDYMRPPISTHPVYEHQPQFADNVMLIPAGHVVNEKVSFPGNIFQGSCSNEGNSICEHCRMAFQRNPVYPGEQPSNMGNGYLQVPNTCVECHPNRDVYMMNSDANLHHPPYYCRDQNDPRSMYSEAHSHERGWIPPYRPSPWVEEPRPPLSVPGRLGDGYIVENGTNFSLGHGNVCEGHHVQPHYTHHEDPRYARSGLDHGGQVFQDQAIATASQVPPAPVEEQTIHGGNPPFLYGNDNLYQMPHGYISTQTPRRNVHGLVSGAPSYENSGAPQVVNGALPVGFVRGAAETSPRVRTGLDNQNPWADPSTRAMGFDVSVTLDYPHLPVKVAPNNFTTDNHPPCNVEPIQPVAVLAKPTVSNDPSVKSDPVSVTDDESVKPVRVNENNVHDDSREAKESRISGGVDKNSDALVPLPGNESNSLKHAVENGSALNTDKSNNCVPGKDPDDQLEFLPELIASRKEATLQNVKKVKAKVQEGTNLGSEHITSATEDAQIHKEDMEGNVDVEVDSDSDNVNPNKIELTKAEAEAIESGLQTIKNEDLEEIRELGSGTYGSVYHGKWKGSDVAIKRIKASCFAGRPSERERLIADFWKEALILSSLHHPNVVAFYGVVRDGPDGSLATVTEFMINGSLKQFLQKKDRTIDRRKRLIIAMDTAFGMEYLHGKNIVHFDLKCENLLVNMRDPHRPVCKIGDLGLSKVKHHTLVSGGVRGTLPWMAPELLSGKSNMVTEKIDVYSFGIVMWELLTGDEPYTNMHCASIIGGIVNNTLRPQIPTWCDPEWKSLMESCWASDPAQRPSFSEISQKLRNMAAAMNLK